MAAPDAWTPRAGALPGGDREPPGFINPIGDWVLSTAITQAASWRLALGGQAFTVVNISGNQLGQHRLPWPGRGPLSGTGLQVRPRWGWRSPSGSSIRRADDAPSDLGALRDLGISLAVDDFGTGYASLDYLRKFEFDEIKIDRSFARSRRGDKTDTAVTSSIIALGRSLDLMVVAEGVETQAQYEHLQRLGCETSPGLPHAQAGHVGGHRCLARRRLCKVRAVSYRRGNSRRRRPRRTALLWLGSRYARRASAALAAMPAAGAAPGSGSSCSICGS